MPGRSDRSGPPQARHRRNVSGRNARQPAPTGAPASRPFTPSLPAGLVLLGEFGRAHGLRGELRLKSYTAEPEAISSYGPLVGADGRQLVLSHVRPAPGAQPDLLIARVEGITTREAADALTRMQLFVLRDRLPSPEEEDEFLLADLIGLSVETQAGAVLGKVLAVPNFGGGDLLEIAPADGGASALLPFTRAFVPVVDIAGRRVVIEPPEDLFAPPERQPETGSGETDPGETE